MDRHTWVPHDCVDRNHGNHHVHGHRVRHDVRDHSRHGGDDDPHGCYHRRVYRGCSCFQHRGHGKLEERSSVYHHGGDVSAHPSPRTSFTASKVSAASTSSASSTSITTSLASRSSGRRNVRGIALRGSGHWLVDRLGGWLRLSIRVFIVVIALVVEVSSCCAPAPQGTYPRARRGSTNVCVSCVPHNNGRQMGTFDLTSAMMPSLTLSLPRRLFLRPRHYARCVEMRKE